MRRQPRERRFCFSWKRTLPRTTRQFPIDGPIPVSAFKMRTPAPPSGLAETAVPDVLLAPKLIRRNLSTQQIGGQQRPSCEPPQQAMLFQEPSYAVAVVEPAGAIFLGQAMLAFSDNGTAIIFPGPSRVGSDPKWDRRSAFNVICRPRSRGGPTRPPTR